MRDSPESSSWTQGPCRKRGRERDRNLLHNFFKKTHCLPTVPFPLTSPLLSSSYTEGRMNFPTHEPHYISVLLKIFYCSLLPLNILNARSNRTLFVRLFLTKKYQNMCFWKLGVSFLTHGMLEG